MHDIVLVTVSDAVQNLCDTVTGGEGRGYGRNYRLIDENERMGKGGKRRYLASASE